jgi:hypothetical protein
LADVDMLDKDIKEKMLSCFFPPQVKLYKLLNEWKNKKAYIGMGLFSLFFSKNYNLLSLQESRILKPLGSCLCILLYLKQLGWIKRE